MRATPLIERNRDGWHFSVTAVTEKATAPGDPVDGLAKEWRMVAQCWI